MRIRDPAAAALVLAFVLAGGGRRGEAGRGNEAPAGAPQENSSYVPDDDERNRKAFVAAERAAAAGDAVAAVRALQSVVEGSPHAVAPAGDLGLSEGAWIAAHHRVARLGAAALSAYQSEYGGRAKDALEVAVRARDAAAIARVAETWLPTAEGRAAALLLADLATERGDADEALGWLERVEDLADVAAPDLRDEVARWRATVLARSAATLAARSEAVPRIRAWLASPRGSRPPDGDFARPRAPDGWPTSGGDASRSRIPPALGSKLAFRWISPSHERSAWGGDEGIEGADRAEGIHPSPWLPSRAVVAGDLVLASDGRFLRAWRWADGREAFLRPLAIGSERIAPEDVVGDVGLLARKRWGWIEGHSLTVAGDLVVCAIAGKPMARPSAGEAGDESAGASPRDPFDLPHLAAVRLRAGGGEVVWRAGGMHPTPGLPHPTSLYGAPLSYAGLLWVAGRRETKSTDRYEAWVVALDPETGAARHAVFLGTGGPIRRKRHDEAIPSSCAGARGRVTVVTSLGIAAAVDARSGRTAWTLRYDRGRPDGDDPGRRLQTEESETSDRRSGFSNEPPLAFSDRVAFAPTDTRVLFLASNRPRGADRTLLLRTRRRIEDFRNLALEQLVGVTPPRDGRPALLVGVGQGYRATNEVHTCVVAMDAETLALVWERPLPDGGAPEPRGRALVTEGEVLVPARNGIARYRLADGGDLSFLGIDAIPSDLRSLLASEDERPWGNLVPVPGRGVLAIDSNSVAFWGVP